MKKHHFDKNTFCDWLYASCVSGTSVIQIGKKSVEVKRGQVVLSIRTVSEIIPLHRQTIRSYLAELQEEGVLIQENIPSAGVLVKMIAYDYYMRNYNDPEIGVPLNVPLNRNLWSDLLEYNARVKNQWYTGFENTPKKGIKKPSKEGDSASKSGKNFINNEDSRAPARVAIYSVREVDSSNNIKKRETTISDLSTNELKLKTHPLGQNQQAKAELVEGKEATPPPPNTAISRVQSSKKIISENTKTKANPENYLLDGQTGDKKNNGHDFDEFGAFDAEDKVNSRKGLVRIRLGDNFNKWVTPEVAEIRDKEIKKWKRETYCFTGHIILVTYADMDGLKDKYPSINVPMVLGKLDDYFFEKGVNTKHKSYWHRVLAVLASEEKKALEAKQAALQSDMEEFLQQRDYDPIQAAIDNFI